MNSNEILNKYINLIDKGYCSDCNELNCIDNFPQAKITHAIRKLQQQNKQLQERIEYLERSIVRKEETITELEQEQVPYTNEYADKVDKENRKLNGAIQTYDILLKANVEENKKLKDNWNKLKEYIKETKLKEFEKSYGKRYGKTFTQAEIIVCNMILDKMQELEEGDK